MAVGQAIGRDRVCARLHSRPAGGCPRPRREPGTGRSVRTLIVSDLHLGSPRLHDILRRREPRVRLFEAAERADRLVLLGDTVELLDMPPRAALNVARPVLDGLAAAMSGREVVVVAGNHDRALVEPWIADHRRPLSLEQAVPPTASAPLEALLELLARANPRAAYPGVWVRPDVYATHGHYLDAHLNLPPPLDLALPPTAHPMGAVPSGDGNATPDDYERAIAGPYRAIAIHAAARFTLPRRGRGSPGGRAAELAGLVGSRLRGTGEGIGPRLIAFKLLRGLEAMGEVVTRLGIGAEHVVFGHIHRAGPLGADDPGRWSATSGPRLHNPGSWLHSPLMLGRRRPANPYWPGACIEVDERSAPRLVRLL